MAGVKIIGKVAVKVMPDTSEFKDKLKRDLEKIERQIGDLKVDVVPQLSKAAEKKVAADLKALQQRLSGKNIDLDPRLDNGAVATVETALAVLTRGRKTKIKVDIDQASIASAFESIIMLGGARPQLDALANSFEKLGRLDYISLTIGGIATKVALLAGAAIAATGQILSMAGSIASIVPAALALPGIIGGLAIGLGATVAAFKDFNKYVPQAAGYMSELQNVISNNFWEQASAQINAFIDGVFPVLRRNLAETGTQLGNFFGNLAESMGTLLNPALDGMFKNLNDSIAIFARYTDDIAISIAVLGSVGSEYLPRLAEWFGELIEQFANFLTKAQNDGSLTRWIETGITNLQALGGIISSVSTIFYGLYTAARDAGGATLVSLNENLKSISDTVNSGGFQSGLTDVFRSAFDMMEAITNGAGPGFKNFLISLGEVFNQVGPALGESLGKALGELFDALSSPTATGGMLAVFDGIQSAISALTPTIRPLVDMFASFGPVIGEMLTQISNIASQGIDTLAPTISGIAEAIVPLIKGIGELFTKISGDLMPVFKIMGDNIRRVVEAFAPLIAKIQDLWNVLSPLLIPVLKIVATIIGDALVGVVDGVTMVFSGLVKIIEGVIKVFTGLWDVIAGIFTLDFGRVLDGFGQIFGGLWDIIVGALEAVAGAVWAWLNGSLFAIFRRAFATIGTKLIAPLQKGFSAALGWLSTGFSWITRGAAEGVTAVGGVFSRILDVLLWPFERFLPGITGHVKAVFDFLADTFGPVFAAIGGLLKATFDNIVLIFRTAFEVIGAAVKGAWDVIKTLFVGAWDGISGIVRGAWDNIVGFFQTSLDGLYFLFKGTWDNIAGFLVALWTDLKVGAQAAWNALRDKIMDAVNMARTRLEMAWDAIKTKVTAVWDAIKSKIENVWDGIKSKVTGAVDSVKEKLGNVWDAIKTKVENVWDSIKEKIDNAWDNIKTKVSNAADNVKDKLSGVWDAVKSKVEDIWGSIKGKIDDTWNDIKSKVSNAADNVKSSMSDAWDAVKTKTGEAWDAVKTKVTEKVTAVIDEIQTVPTKAKNALAGIGGVLVNAGASLIQGLIDGIQSMIDDVQAKLGELTDILPDWKGPAEKDKVLLKPAGELIIKGFIAGLESRYKDVRSSLQGLTSDIAKDFDSGSSYRVGVTAELDSSSKGLSAIGGLTNKVSTAAAPAAVSGGNVRIDNITIPLEDLKQLNDLEGFLDMLRVRTRQGVIA